MFYSHPMNTKYFVSDSTIDYIIKIIDKYNCKNIFYVGYADKNLVVKIRNKDGCQIVLADYFGITHKEIHAWGDDGEDIDLDKEYPIPDWAKDIPVHIEGIGKHDILLVDLPHDASFEYNFPAYGSDYSETFEAGFANIVILFGEADFKTFTDKDLYYWEENNNMKIGILKTEKNNLDKQAMPDYYII